MVEIRACTVAEVFDNPAATALWNEYAREAAMPGLGVHDPQVAQYAQLEAVGVLHTLCAFIEGELVGLVTVLVSMSPHWGRLMASTESFFVRDKARHTGAGLALLEAAEAHCTALGVHNLFIIAGMNSRLIKIIPHRGFTECHRVFHKPLR